MILDVQSSENERQLNKTYDFGCPEFQKPNKHNKTYDFGCPELQKQNSLIKLLILDVQKSNNPTQLNKTNDFRCRERDKPTKKPIIIGGIALIYNFERWNLNLKGNPCIQEC